MLKSDLKVWSRDVFGCLESSKKRLLKNNEDLDIKDNLCDLDNEAKLKRMEIFSQLRVIDNKLNPYVDKKLEPLG